MDSASWSIDRALDNDLVVGLLESQFPQLGPAHVTGWYEGMDNQAIEINQEWIFRFPKRAEGDPFLRMELNLLPRLEVLLPSLIPRYEWIGQPGEQFPYMFAGYRKLPGVPGITIPAPDIDRLGPVLGGILSAIHSFPVEEALRLGVYVPPEDSIQDQLEEALEWVEQVRPVLPGIVYERAHAALQGVGAISPYSGPGYFLHADFSSEHLLLDPVTEKVTGIIDWTDASAGDPALDLSYLWVWQGEPLVEAVLQHYTGESDPGFRKRVRLYGVCTALADLAYGLEANQEQNRRVGLEALEREFGR